MTFPFAKAARRKAHRAKRVEGKNKGLGVTHPQALVLEDHQNRYCLRDAVRQWKHDERIIKRRREDAVKQEAAKADCEVPAFGT